MQAGSLKNRMTIQQQSATQDEIGQPVSTWTTFATVWAEIRHKSGMESIKSGEVTSTVKASIRVRYKAGVTAAMRVVHGSVTYQIQSVLRDVANKDYMDLVCEVYGG